MHVGEVQFSVGDLPEQEVGDALLPAGAYDQVGVRQVRRVESLAVSREHHRHGPAYPWGKLLGTGGRSGGPGLRPIPAPSAKKNVFLSFSALTNKIARLRRAILFVFFIFFIFQF